MTHAVDIYTLRSVLRKPLLDGMLKSEAKH